MPSGVAAEKIAIVGAGIGGLYLIAELGLAGFKLRLHDIDDSRLSETARLLSGFISSLPGNPG